MKERPAGSRERERERVRGEKACSRRRKGARGTSDGRTGCELRGSESLQVTQRVSCGQTSTWMMRLGKARRLYTTVRDGRIASKVRDDVSWVTQGQGEYRCLTCECVQRAVCEWLMRGARCVSRALTVSGAIGG